MFRNRCVRAAIVVAVLSTIVVTPSVALDPISKIWFENRSVPTILNLGRLPDCCLEGEAEYRAELEAALAALPNTPCTADDGLNGSSGDLLVTPFGSTDPRATPVSDGKVLVRFANRGQLTLAETVYRLYGEPHICGGNPFYDIDADVTISTKVKWVKAPGTPYCPGSSDHYSLRYAALHELGHAIGMEHTNRTQDVMYTFADPCDFSKDSFLPGDQAQFDFIYACEDIDCGEEIPSTSSETSCKDGLDNDGDGQTDCADPDCAGSRSCTEKCRDGIDNDADGLIDCDDSECTGRGFCRKGSLEDGRDARRPARSPRR